MGVDVRHLVVNNFRSLEVDLRLDGEFRLLGFNFRALGIYHEPKGADIWSLRVKAGPLGVYVGHKGVQFEPLVVVFGPLTLEFRFNGINLDLMTSMLGIW